jgi:hypothetical protein
LYFCMPNPGTPDLPVPVQKLNRLSPLVALPAGSSSAYVHVIETELR